MRLAPAWPLLARTHWHLALIFRARPARCCRGPRRRATGGAGHGLLHRLGSVVSLVLCVEDKLGDCALLLSGEAVPKRRHAAPASVDLEKDLGAGELLAGVEVRADPPTGVCGADPVTGPAPSADEHASALTDKLALACRLAATAGHRGGAEECCGHQPKHAPIVAFPSKATNRRTSRAACTGSDCQADADTSPRGARPRDAGHTAQRFSAGRPSRRGRIYG